MRATTSFRAGAWRHRTSWHLLAALALIAAAATPAGALGIGGTTGATAKPKSSTATAGYFDGRQYALELYFAPLIGYESNYQLSADGGGGSALWALEGGATLRYRPSSALRLRTELSATLRQVTAVPELVDYSTDLLAQLLYSFGPGLELNLANHFGSARSRTAPVLFDTQSAGGSPGGSPTGTIRYDTIYDALRPALAYRIAPSLLAEVGPYVRVKQVTFLENPYGGEPDYRLYDLGADALLRWMWRGALAVRLSYDVAQRWFSNYPARPPQHVPTLDVPLRMVRHALGGRIWARPQPWLQLFGSYHLRLTDTNGGFLEHTDHLLGGGVELSWGERVSASASLLYFHRRYTNRTACEAQQRDDGSLSPGDCSAVPAIRQIQRESGLIASISADVALLDWLQLTARYELEDANSDQHDPLRANHRIMSGAALHW